MKKTAFIILFLYSQAYALVGDITGDNIVDVNDFVIFCDYWLQTPVIDPNCDFDENGQIDFVDYALMAQNWTGHLEWPPPLPPQDTNQPPQITDCNFIGYAFITKEITLTATPGDFNITGYKIVSVPNDINVYLQDPASGTGRITNNLLPYRLRNHGSTLWLAADNNEVFTFKWRATDGTRDSNDANCTVNVLANPKDHISFDYGTVSIPSEPNLDFADGRCIAFFIQTRTPFCPIIKKHGGGAGYEITLESGRPKLELFDANNTKIYSARGDFRVDNGIWWQVIIASPNDCDYTQIMLENETELYEQYYTEGPNWPGVDINNTEPLVILTKWELDNIRFYKDYDEGDCVIGPMYQGHIRQIPDSFGNVAGDAGMFLREADIRFLCDEGGGNTITDDKKGLIGTFADPNFVKWTPYNWYWADINVQKYRRIK